MKTRIVACWFVACFSAARAAAVQAETIIDDFSVGPLTKIANTADYNSTSSQSGLDSQHLIIGQRRLTLQGDMSSGSVEATIDAAVGGRLHYLPHTPVFSTDNTFHRDYGGRIILTYLPGDRFTSYDFASLAPGSAFAIDVISADFGTKGSFRGQIGMNGFDALGTFTLHNSSTPYTILVPFSSLLINPMTTKVGSLTFDFMDLDYSGIPAAGTFVLDAIRVVPEPSGLLIGTLACLTIVAPSVRRRQCVEAGRRLFQPEVG
jgi:hypothetical protein